MSVFRVATDVLASTAAVTAVAATSLAIAGLPRSC
jgi:hypothetical protein